MGKDYETLPAINGGIQAACTSVGARIDIFKREATKAFDTPRSTNATCSLGVESFVVETLRKKFLFLSVLLLIYFMQIG